jgi:hypothetical protein
MPRVGRGLPATQGVMAGKVNWSGGGGARLRAAGALSIRAAREPSEGMDGSTWLRFGGWFRAALPVR